MPAAQSGQKTAKMAAVPVPKAPAKMAVPAAIDWAAASKYVRYAAPVFAWKPVTAVSRALTGAAGAAGAGSYGGKGGYVGPRAGRAGQRWASSYVLLNKSKNPMNLLTILS